MGYNSILIILLIIAVAYVLYFYGSQFIDKHDKELGRYKTSKIATCRIGTWKVLRAASKLVLPNGIIEDNISKYG